MDRHDEPVLRCVCKRCTRARWMSDMRAAAGVMFWTLIMIAAVIGGCLLVVGCSTTKVSECDSGYSWRGDCSQRLFKE